MIVVRVSETDFRAFSAVCTHLACIVEYRKAKQNRLQLPQRGVQPAGAGRRRAAAEAAAAFSVHLVAGTGGSQQVIVSRS